MNKEENKPNHPPEDAGPLPPLLGEPEKREIFEIHKDILERERREPVEGLEPTPWWVWAVSVVVVFAMGFYLGRYGGAFNADPHVLYERSGPVAAAAEAAPRGDEVFAGVCLPCHQAGGVGLPGKYPPLAGSEWVVMDPGVPVRILLHGLSGPIEVKGVTYVNEMPPQGEQLTDAEIAAVLTHVRSSFGNKAGPVERELVEKIRKSEPSGPPMTAEKLKELVKAK